MCAGASHSLGLLDDCCTDEDLILFLGERKVGDPVPSNVTVEVNPFCLEPWDVPVHDRDEHLDPKLVQQEETEPLENHSNGFQACIGDWHRRPSSERNTQASVAHNSVEESTASNYFSDDAFLELISPVNFAAYDFSKGDYLEINDLFSLVSSLSSSDDSKLNKSFSNSSFMSENLDEYFDSDDLLRDIGCESELNLNEEGGCKLSVAASVCETR